MDGGEIHLADAAKRQIHVFSSTGTFLRAERLHTASTVASAVHIPRGWAISGVAVDGAPVIEVLGTDWRHSLSTAARVDVEADAQAIASMSLRVSGRGRVLASDNNYPFRLAALEPSGSFSWLAAIPAGVLDSLDATEQGWQAWLALPALPLVGDLLVQMLVDLGSPKRLLLLRDKTGQVVRATRFNVPIGLVAGSADGRTVLAYGRYPDPQLLCYSVSAANLRDRSMLPNALQSGAD
jgi:hypothetical protein